MLSVLVGLGLLLVVAYYVIGCVIRAERNDDEERDEEDTDGWGV